MKGRSPRCFDRWLYLRRSKDASLRATWNFENERIQERLPGEPIRSLRRGLRRAAFSMDRRLGLRDPSDLEFLAPSSLRFRGINRAACVYAFMSL